MWGTARKLVLQHNETRDETDSKLDFFEDEKEVVDPIDHEVTDGVESEKLDPGHETPVKSIFELIARLTRDKQLKKKANQSAEGSPRSQATPKSNVLEEEDEEEMESLMIKEEDLLTLRKSIEEMGLYVSEKKDDETQKKTFSVRKPKPQGEIKPKRTNKFHVAKPAPQGASLEIPEKTPTGPRYAKTGEIIPHSVVGTIRDFVEEALKRNEIRPDSPAVLHAPVQKKKLEVKKYDRKWPLTNEYIPTSMNQENALRNWRRKMAERKRVQGRISNLLEKPLDRLIMNQEMSFRKNQETKQVIDRAIPAYDYGKGYRVNSEFWNQCEPIGDDETGIKMTLTKTERGSPVIFEHVGKPLTIQHEVGETWQGDQPTRDPKRSWSSSKYLRKRMNQLEPVMTSLDPHKPKISNLEVIGNETDGYIYYHENAGGEIEKSAFDNNENEKDPLASYPDVVAHPVVGPGLLFDGKLVYWTGPKSENQVRNHAEARVCFQSIIKKKSYSEIKIENVGTTALFYEWRKIPNAPSFSFVKTDSVQRFYFNTGEAFILPGDTATIPFVFKSPNAGIFSESWEFVTKPCLMSGAMLQVTLRGVADEDEQTTSQEREQFDKGLREKEALFDVQQIIYDIIKGIQSPERAPTPIDAYITEEDIFERKNPGRYYDHDTIAELKHFYLQLFGEDDREGRVWDLSLDELQSCVTAVPDESAQEEMLLQLNLIIGRLSIPPMTPLQRKMYTYGYKCWQNAIDKLVGCSMMARSIMGLPEMVMTEAAPATEAETTIVPPAATPSGKSDAKDDKKGKGKKGKDAKEDKGKKGKKDAKDSRPKSKDTKGKGGKGAASTPTKELQLPDQDGSKTPSSARTAPSDSLDPSVRRKYTESVYGQVYDLFIQMIEDMATGFEDARLTSS